MRAKATPIGLLLCVALGASASAVAAASAGPKERTEMLVETLKAVKAPPEEGVLSVADRKQNADLFKTLDGFFDYDKLIAETIAPNAKAFSEQQRKHFHAVFQELIRLVAYPNSGTFLNEAKVNIGKAKVRNTLAAVKMLSEVPAEDLETDVEFTWHRQGKQGWRVVDVSFDGASLVKDYQNQFARIIKKDGVTGLLSKLDSRLEKERETASVN